MTLVSWCWWVELDSHENWNMLSFKVFADGVLFNAPTKNLSLIWQCPSCWLGSCYGGAKRDLHSATPAVTQDLSLFGLAWRNHPHHHPHPLFSCLLQEGRYTFKRPISTHTHMKQSKRVQLDGDCLVYRPVVLWPLYCVTLFSTSESGCSTSIMVLYKQLR
jgi:hypothetical protein